jgi:dolichyl-phosphate-mannose-protein mannosyltransferase
VEGIPAAIFTTTTTTAKEGALSNRRSLSSGRIVSIDHLFIVLLSALAFWTRLGNLHLNPAVVWDEAHFGRFASYYAKRQLYFDVHPPLGKMLIAWAGWMAGFDGAFNFGERSIPPGVPYHQMRCVPAVFGALTVPVAYLTARVMGYSRWAAVLAAWMVALDNALVSTSRLILLDPILLFFVATTVWCQVNFSAQQSKNCRHFSLAWWLWLLGMGMSLGAATSVKWVGLAVTALVGMYTVYDLWTMLGNMQMSLATYASHWGARIVALILLPVTLYLASFAIHFAVLNESGPGSPHMHSLFQAQRDPASFVQPAEVLIGSRVTLRSQLLGGTLLHSHPIGYPQGSTQQQVVGSAMYDRNDDWLILRPHNTVTGTCIALARSSSPGTYLPTKAANRRRLEPLCGANLDIGGLYVRDRDVVRFVHAPTRRHLHSHAVPAPVTGGAFEVSGYGNATAGEGDRNDLWRIEIVHDDAADDHALEQQTMTRGLVRPVTTRFLIRHLALGCLLRQQHHLLPDWGGRQQEVVCDPDVSEDHAGTMWNIEHHWNKDLANTPLTFPLRAAAPSRWSRVKAFLYDTAYLHATILRTHDSFVVKRGKATQPASTWLQWPFLHVGIRMTAWTDDSRKLFMIGNPVVWWGASASVLAALLLWAWYILRARRRCQDAWRGVDDRGWRAFQSRVVLCGMGWCLHYLPFGLATRVLYLHHYFPALYFGILLLAGLVDHIVLQRLVWKDRPTLQCLVYGGIGMLVAWTFWHFRLLSYGFVGPAADHVSHLQWRRTWALVN